MDSGKDKRYSDYSAACGPCIKQGWPNQKQGRKCLLKMASGVSLEDFYRNEVWVYGFDDLYKLYQLFEEQRLKRAAEKLGLMGGSVPNMEADDFTDWLVKRGICPHALVSANSRYLFETCVLLDGEMGLTFPDPKLSIGETPALFFQALNTVRASKHRVREEDRDTK